MTRGLGGGVEREREKETVDETSLFTLSITFSSARANAYAVSHWLSSSPFSSPYA